MATSMIPNFHTLHKSNMVWQTPRFRSLRDAHNADEYADGFECNSEGATENVADSDRKPPATPVRIEKALPFPA